MSGNGDNGIRGNEQTNWYGDVNRLILNDQKEFLWKLQMILTHFAQREDECLSNTPAKLVATASNGHLPWYKIES